MGQDLVRLEVEKYKVVLSRNPLFIEAWGRTH